MREEKKHTLRNAGYRVTDTKEFLGLSDSEAALIELKIAEKRRQRSARHRNARVPQATAGGVRSPS